MRCGDCVSLGFSSSSKTCWTLLRARLSTWVDVRRCLESWKWAKRWRHPEKVKGETGKGVRQVGAWGGQREETEEWGWVRRVTESFYDGDNCRNSPKKKIEEEPYWGAIESTSYFPLEEMLCKRALCSFVCWWMQSENLSFLFQPWPRTRACSPFKSISSAWSNITIWSNKVPWFMWLIQVEWCSWQNPLNCLVWELNQRLTLSHSLCFLWPFPCPPISLLTSPHSRLPLLRHREECLSTKLAWFYKCPQTHFSIDFYLKMILF